MILAIAIVGALLGIIAMVHTDEPNWILLFLSLGITVVGILAWRVDYKTRDYRRKMKNN